jgi:uncharacterized delta-60 repeat protein
LAIARGPLTIYFGVMRLGRGLRRGVVVALAGGCLAAAGAGAYGGFPGQLDPAFGGQGSVPLEASQVNASIDVLPGGKILTLTGTHLKRLNPNGSVDQSFGQGGEVTLPSEAFEVLHDASGRIVVRGFMPVAYGCLIRRFNSQGEPDRSFGTNGEVSISRPRCFDIAVDRNRIVVLGLRRATKLYEEAGMTHFGVARLLPSGELDKTFMGRGYGWRRFDRFPFGNATSIAVDSRRRIVVGGSVIRGERPAVAFVRFTEAGRFDRAFSGDGRVRISTGKGTRYTYATRVEMQLGPGDGVTATCGFGILPSISRSCIVRLGPAGERVRGFSGDGFRWVDLVPDPRPGEVNQGNESLGSLALGRGGRVLVAGTVTRRIDTAGRDPGADFYSAMVRFKKDGTLDREFWKDGSFVGRFFESRTRRESISALATQDRVRTLVAVRTVPAVAGADQFLFRLFD